MKKIYHVIAAAGWLMVIVWLFVQLWRSYVWAQWLHRLQTVLEQ